MTSPLNNIIFNTNSSYENNNNIELSINNKTIKFPETIKNPHKGEEICNKRKNINEIINKRLIKALNSASVNLDNSTTLRTKRKQKNIKTKTKTVDKRRRTKSQRSSIRE